MKYVGSTLWRNSLMSTGTTLLQGFVNLATVMYLARVLAPTGYGVFSYTWAFTALFGFLAYLYLGVPPLLTRQLARNTKDAKEQVSYGVTLMVWLSGTVMLLFVISAQIIPVLMHYRMLFDWRSLIFLQAGLNPQWIFSSLQSLWIPMSVNFAGALLRLGFLILFVHSPTDLRAAVVLTVTTLTLPLVVEFVWLCQLLSFRFVCFSWTKGLRTIRESLPMGIIAFVTIL